MVIDRLCHRGAAAIQSLGPEKGHQEKENIQEVQLAHFHIFVAGSIYELASHCQRAGPRNVHLIIQVDREAKNWDEFMR